MLLSENPMILIGSDHARLITLVIHGPPGPVAVYTKLCWALKGSTNSLLEQDDAQACLHLSFNRSQQKSIRLQKRLRQVDILPFRNENEDEGARNGISKH